MLWSYTLSLPDTSFQSQLVQYFLHMLLLREELQSVQTCSADPLSSVTHLPLLSCLEQAWRTWQLPGENDSLWLDGVFAAAFILSVLALFSFTLL